MRIDECPRDWEYVQQSLRRRLPDDDETRDRALAYVWYQCLRYSTLPPLVPLIHRSIQSVQAGRDLPGCGLTAAKDVFSRFERVPAGSGKKQRKSGHDVAELAASREHWGRFVRRCRGRQLDVLTEFARDWNATNRQVAEAIGSDKTYVLRTRRKLAALAAQE